MKEYFTERMACGLCGSGSDALQKVQNIENFPIMKCSSCGFIQTGKLLDSKKVNEYYEGDYGGLRMQQGQKVNATVNFKIIKKILDLKAGEKILDVGCGYGYFLKKLKDKLDIQTTGVELALSELEFARENLGLDVKDSLDNLVKEKFNVVCLFEVIEHITEPLNFIETLITYLKPGGKLILATDNFNSNVVNSMGNKFPKWIPHQHISLFDENSLPLLINKTGKLSIEAKFSFTPWELLLRSKILNLSNGKYGGREFNLNAELNTEYDRPYPFYSLRKIFNSEWAKFTLKKNLSGEMMYIIAQKN